MFHFKAPCQLRAPSCSTLPRVSGSPFDVESEDLFPDAPPGEGDAPNSGAGGSGPYRSGLGGAAPLRGSAQRI